MENWIQLERRDNEYIRFVCAYFSRISNTANLVEPAHDYDRMTFNVGDWLAVEYLAEAFDAFSEVYLNLYCIDFPGVYQRVSYAVNTAID